MNILIEALGGLGLFLLGMLVMTDALRMLAGEMIRNALMRFTRNPLTGAITGTLSTAILQSSSATTVAAVGFVSAGLITFSGSLGVIFGANIGTTITGWIVALVGFKLQLSTLMLPLIFVGVVLRLSGNQKISNFGMALAGFGLIFVGISIMQQGMVNLQDVVTPEIFPTDTLAGRLKLVAFGIMITIITQSSSAGVATAITAVYTGAINFEQAAALVIGMDVGTTVTAAIATIGGSVNSRRTGYSHVIYNCMTAVGALILLTPFTLLWERLSPGFLINNAEIALVAFHSTFNFIGVLVILPFTGLFARFIQRLIPDKADAYTESLDRKLLTEPELALGAAKSSIQMELHALLEHLGSMIKGRVERNMSLPALQIAIDETHGYIDEIHLEKTSRPTWNILLAMIHSLDHMQRLHERCEEDVDRADAVKMTPELKRYSDELLSGLGKISQYINDGNWPQAEALASSFSSMINEEARIIRQQIMVNVAQGQLSVTEGTDSLEGVRWLRRVSAHVLKIVHYQMLAHDLLTRKR